MGKALAIAAVTFIALGTYYNGVRSSSELDTRRRVSNNQYEAISRGAALAGINVAKQKLSETWNAGVQRGNHQGGSYAVQSKVNQNRAEIASVGTIRNAGRHSENYAVNVLLERRLKIPPEPPVWMQYAIATDSDITLSGSATVSISVTGEAGAELNANIHTNGNLSVNGSNIFVEGFGSYAGTSSGTHLESSFAPNYNPAGLPGVTAADPVPIPNFSDVDYANFAGPDGQSYVDNTSTGVVELSGSYNFGGTREDPYVWHISGDLRVTGDVVIDGYTIFVVDGKTKINGNLAVGDSGYTGGTESSIAVYTSGNAEFGGSSTIEAQMFVGGNSVFAKGTPTVTGNIVTNGEVMLSGTPDINYRPASAALTQFWQTFEYSHHIIGYHEQ